MSLSATRRQSKWKGLQERDDSLAFHDSHLVASVRGRAWRKIAHLSISHNWGSIYSPDRTSFPHIKRQRWEGGPVLVFKASSALSLCLIFFFFQMQGFVLMKIKMSVRPSLVHAWNKSVSVSMALAFLSPLCQQGSLMVSQGRRWVAAWNAPFVSVGRRCERLLDGL